MRALVWITEDSWQATVAEAGATLPADADVTLLHVDDDEAQGVVRAARDALLGRQHAVPAAPADALEAISTQAAQELLAQAAAALGRPARTAMRRGRVEREVVAAAGGMDLLILARDGELERLGPRSLGRAARFVIDHAPCRVLLIWPSGAPALTTIPPPPERPPPFRRASR
jgi:nucleotide-binding universal stress UspA family protein